MNVENLIQRLDGLIEIGSQAQRTVKTNDRGGKSLHLEVFYQFRTASISFILKLYGDKHPYLKEFSEHAKQSTPSCVERGVGILLAIRNEVESGWLSTTRGLISAEIFGDFLEMAEHLLDENYKDPAAVLIGSALEQHLKNIAIANDVSLTYPNKNGEAPKKADVLNADLVKAGVYSKIDQKSITSWLGIRNDAAHGKFDGYNDEQVRFMLVAVAEFMGRVST
ncbi:Uncharacterised protein [BD1-7 clade bacterium]|uniref:DUF4145 domain-containing protein n=1 Tax=BD1-7 clade bacterium TaxID=2029982 RepID=A0A5S9QIE6_9GAMM|nr:Uncharacterised protein [BD1-7 clade bacterium]